MMSDETGRELNKTIAREGSRSLGGKDVNRENGWMGR